MYVSYIVMSLSYLFFEKTYNKSRSSQSQDRPALPFLGPAGPRPETPRGLESQPRPAPPPETSGPRLGLPEADPRPGHTNMNIVVVLSATLIPMQQREFFNE